jgi:hypothetical protein
LPNRLRSLGLIETNRKERFMISKSMGLVRISVCLILIAGSVSTANAQNGHKPRLKSAEARRTAPSPTPSEEVQVMPSPSATPEAAVMPEPSATPVLAPTATPTSEEVVESSPSNFVFGPYIAVGLPRPISGGLELKYADLVGLSASYGYLPELTVSSVKLKLNGWDARAKIYLFQGSFFLGVAYGSQKFTGSQTQTINGQVVTGVVNQDNTFIAPHIGWNWGSNTSGFFAGIELGVQLSLKRSSAFTSDADASVQATTEYTNLKKDIEDKSELVGKTPLPLISLIKIGYLF